jgi:hypothetical protein
MINNSTIINKANSHLSPQIIKHIKDHDICWGVKPVNRISTPLLIIGNPDGSMS